MLKPTVIDQVVATIFRTLANMLVRVFNLPTEEGYFMTSREYLESVLRKIATQLYMSEAASDQISEIEDRLSKIEKKLYEDAIEEVKNGGHLMEGYKESYWVNQSSDGYKLMRTTWFNFESDPSDKKIECINSFSDIEDAYYACRLLKQGQRNREADCRELESLLHAAYIHWNDTTVSVDSYKVLSDAMSGYSKYIGKRGL